MSGQGEGVLPSQGTRSTLYFLELLCSALEYLRTRAAKGCLHMLRVEVIGHRDCLWHLLYPKISIKLWCYLGKMIALTPPQPSNEVELAGCEQRRGKWLIIWPLSTGALLTTNYGEGNSPTCDSGPRCPCSVLIRWEVPLGFGRMKAEPRCLSATCSKWKSWSMIMDCGILDESKYLLPQEFLNLTFLLFYHLLPPSVF